MADRIIIKGIQFYGYHGVPDAEQSTGHRYEVDVELEVDLAAAVRTDEVSQTVDYGSVIREVLKLGTGRQYRLIEALGGAIVEQLLIDHPRVLAATVRVKKLQPPVPAVVEYAAVELTRRREDSAQRH
jgi:dihydroneopterin aldolase